GEVLVEPPGATGTETTLLRLSAGPTSLNAWICTTHAFFGSSVSVLLVIGASTRSPYFGACQVATTVSGEAVLRRAVRVFGGPGRSLVMPAFATRQPPYEFCAVTLTTYPLVRSRLS